MLRRRNRQHEQKDEPVAEAKTGQITRAAEDERADLLQAIYDSRQQIDQMKGQLSRPVATITSLIFLGLIMNLFLKRASSFQLEDSLQEEILTAHDKLYLTYSPEFASAQQIRDTAKSVIDNFEKELLRNAKMFAAEKPVFRAQLNITGADENTWPFPWQWAQLPPQGNQHLFFKMAQFFDWSFRWIQSIPEAARPLLENYKQAYNLTVIAIFNGMLHSTVTEEQRILFPEYQGDRYDLTAPTMTVQRLAEMIRSFYPNFLAYDIQFAEEKSRMMTEVNSDLRVVFLIGSAFAVTPFVKILLINPLCKIFFPLNRCLTEPLDSKINYQRLNLASLRIEEKKLDTAKQQLSPYVKRAQTSNYWLSGILLLAFIYFFKNTSGIIDQRVLIALFGDMLLSKIAQTYDHCTLTSTLKKLQDNLLTIAGEAKSCFKIAPVNQGEQAFSHVTVSVVGNYQILPAKHLINLLKITLNRFGIAPIPSSSTKRFSLPADTSFTDTPLIKSIPFVKDCFTNFQAIKRFFARSLQRSLQTYQLEQQVGTFATTLASKGIRITYEKNVTLDSEGLFQCEFVIPAIPQQAPLLSAFQQLGFVQSDDAWVLTQHEAYPETKLKTITTSLTRALASQPDSHAASGASGGSSSRRTGRGRTQEDKHTTAPVVDTPQPAAPPTESKGEAKEQKVRTWPCGAMFPGPHVKEVAGGTREYVVTDNLTLDDYGGDKVAQTLFSEKSKQKAPRAENTQGIKVRPTLFNHGVVRGNRLKPARVKIVSDNYGDSAVGLDIEKDATGATLYIPMGFQSGGIH